ncbi:unnamed protein product [Nippostrongylus brasiliensis]|uniref:Ribosome biogenesis protein NOP53 n=1 Tax=Nippostrongylus brasiliensis TaxID=27835 RepID=A0A0N4Y4K6_NIPBR|nr:unnamed protein product [Nippostrongylus brasiliensis]
MVLPTGNTRKAAKRTSRHKKKYWRKGTEITDVEDAMLAKAYGKADLKDDGDVTIERSSLQEGQRTKRQQAALDKISRSIGYVASEKKSTDVERKTKRQRLRAAKEKRLQRELKRQKAIAKKQHDVFKAKSINKALAAEEKEILEKAAERKKKKFLKKMTTRQRLGGGEFKNCEEPFLLQEELTDSLRLLKPQSNILNDRFASLQQRNILPIGGEKNKRKLKSKLKRKFVEKRSVAAVTKGSRII